MNMASTLSLILLANLTFNDVYTPPIDTPRNFIPSIESPRPPRIAYDESFMKQPASKFVYTYTPGIGAYKIHTEATNWHKARRICEKEGGHLAIINSVIESEVLKKLLQESMWRIRNAGNTVYAFIGFHSPHQDGEFETVDGESLNKTVFQPGFYHCFVREKT